MKSKKEKLFSTDRKEEKRKFEHEKALMLSDVIAKSNAQIALKRQQ
jgi:hypothetical protein